MLKQTKNIWFGFQVHLFPQRLFGAGFELKALISIPIFCEACLQQRIIQGIRDVSNHRSFSSYIKKLIGRSPATPTLSTHGAAANLPFTGNWGKCFLHSPFPIKLSPAPHSVNSIRFQGQLQQLLEIIFRRYIVLSAI